MGLVMSQSTYNLYPEIEPFNKNHLKAGNLHQIYYEECGNPDGISVVFLHGGPGSVATQRSDVFLIQHIIVLSC